MLKNLATVNKWYQTTTQSEFPTPLLQKSFERSTDIGGQFSQIYFFSNIWIPVPKKVKEYYGPIDPETHQPTIPTELEGLDPEAFYVNGSGQYEYKYENIGLEPDDLADIYMTQYGYNVLSVPITDPDMLDLKMTAIFKKNYGKYVKLLETLGYAYCPLWNVDGTEQYQYIDSHGDITRTDTPILQTDQELKTAPYDSGTYNATNKTINTYNGTESTSTETHDPVASNVAGIITDMTSGDYSHIEKRLRQGNIGVVSTVKLIEEQRDCVRFSLIQEFFDDINKQLLVGIFPGF